MVQRFPTKDRDDLTLKKEIPPMRGFTLIELLIVIAIILILIAIALPNFLEAQMRAKVTKANSEIRTLAVGCGRRSRRRRGAGCACG